MKKLLLLLLTSSISVSASFAQTFKCPTISYRNNGNNSNCPGEVVTDKQGNTSIPVAVNSGLSTYSVPTTTKEGTITMEFDQKYSDVPTLNAVKDASGTALNVQFGPPSNWTTKTNSYALDYCFYNMDLPAAGKLFVLVINKGATGNSYNSCTYDGQTLVVAPSIVTQPVGQLNICKGSNYTFSCSATASGNNTTLSYQWKKNGTAISGATSSSFGLSSVSNSDNGDYTVVVTETYSSGNAIKQESNVAKLLIDAIKPTAIAQNLAIDLDAQGSAIITASQINNGSKDDCGIKSYALSKYAFDCTNVGTNSVVLTVTDNNDNESTADAVVTVKDVTAPTAKAKNFTLNLNANGQATLLSSDINDGSSDACGIASYALSKENFNDKNVGDNTVTLTVTDKNGNSSTANATVTVKDITAPEAKAKDITVELDSDGNVTIKADDVDNGSTDACGIKSKTVSPSSFTCANLGNNTVTLTVTDVNNNVSTTTSVVTVLDKLAPKAYAKNITVELNASGSASIVASDVNNISTDNCGIKSLSIDKTSFDCSNVGDNDVVLTVTDNSNNVSTATAKVTVKDVIAPTANAKNITVELNASGSASIVASDVNNSSDNCGIKSLSIDKTTFDCSNLGDNDVVLTVTDNSNNVSTATAKVTVKDVIAPTASAKNITVELNASGSASIVASDVNNSSDNCGIKSLSIDKTTFDCSNLGDNDVVLTVTDNSNNVSTATAKVTVKDVIAPTANAKNITVELNASSGSASIVASDVNNSSDNCGIKSLSIDKTTFDCSNLGDNDVVLTVTDNSNNVSTATAKVTVKDVTAPAANAKNFTLNLDENGEGFVLSSDINNGSFDACGIASYTLSKEKFDKNDLGNQEITLTVTDKNGNKSSDKSTVTVKDITPPSVKTKDIEITITNGNDVTVVSNDINDGSKDNCGISKYTLTGSKTKFGCSDRDKSFTVTLTAEDASGNSASATANVKVKGTLTAAPSITNDWTAFSGRYFYPYHSSKVKFTTTTKSGYTYSWSGNDISGSTSGSSVEVLPTKEGKLTLTATAKDGDGCVASSTASLCVFDISVPGSNNTKVYVCHNKGSNSVGAPDNVTLETSISGANTHLTQHSKDGIGVCGTTYDCSKLSGRSNQTESGVVGQLLTAGELSFMVYPNPSDDRFMVEVESEGVTTVSQVRILDMSGRIVETATLNPNVAIEVGRDLIPGIYNIQVSNGGMVSSSRLIKR